MSTRRRSLCALLLLLPAPSLGTAAAVFWWPGTSLGTAVFVAAKLWILLLPVVWLLAVDRGRIGWSPPRHGGFGMGIGIGLAIAAVIVAAYAIARHSGWIDAELVVRRAARTELDHRAVYAAGAVYWITINSLLEEYVWRWFVFRKFEDLIGGPWAVMGSAAGFTLHHIVALAGQFPPLTVLAGSLGIFAGGVAWSWLYLRYQSIWPAYVSHALADVPIFVIGYCLIFGG